MKLNKEPIIEYLHQQRRADEEHDRRTATPTSAALERRIAGDAGLAGQARSCCEADADAEYAAVIEIDLAEITEPILCCPNDPDDAKPLSAVQGTKIDEVFIGSCMTNIGHFRAASQAARRQARHPGEAVGRAADQDGRRAS